MSRTIKAQKKTLKEKICIFLVLVGMSGLVYFIASNLRDERLDAIKYIKKDFVLTEGIVKEKNAYKGNFITVNYKVNDKIYEASDGIRATDNVEVGDTISLKYSKSRPELMMTIFNEEYQ